MPSPLCLQISTQVEKPLNLLDSKLKDDKQRRHREKEKLLYACFSRTSAAYHQFLAITYHDDILELPMILMQQISI